MEGKAAGIRMIDMDALSTKDKANAGSSMDLVHPDSGDVILDDSGKPITFLVAGQDSDVWQEAAQANQDRRLQASRRARSRKKIEETFEVTAADLAEESLDVLVKVTLGWSWMKFRGQVLECTPANVRLLYTHAPWIRDQVEAFVTDRANFFSGSKAS